MDRRREKFAAQIADFGAKAWKVIKPLGGVKFILGALVTIPFLPAIAGIASLGVAMLGCTRGLAALAGMPTTIAMAMKLGGAIAGCTRAVAGFLITMGPVGWALLAVGLAIGAVYWKWDLISKKITEFSGPILEKAKTSLDQFAKNIYDWASSAKKNVLSFSIAIGASITKTFDDLKIKIDNWFNWIGGKFQWIGDSVKKAGGWFGGSNLPSSSSQALAGARALGGPVSAGKRYLVGERGPEIFQPRASGQIIPNGATNNRTINNHITIHAAHGMNERTLADLVIARLNRQQAALAGGALYD